MAREAVCSQCGEVFPEAEAFVDHLVLTKHLIPDGFPLEDSDAVRQLGQVLGQLMTAEDPTVLPGCEPYFGPDDDEDE